MAESETSTIPRGYSQCITCGFMFPSGNVHHCPTMPIPNPRLFEAHGPSATYHRPHQQRPNNAS